MRTNLICATVGCLMALFVTISTATQDINYPVMSGFSLSPTEINTSVGPQTVIAQFTLTDSLTGVDSGFVSFMGANSSQVVTGNFTAANRISGTAQNGVYQVSLVFPQYSQNGTFWPLCFSSRDVIGNASMTWGRISYTGTKGESFVKTNAIFLPYSAVHPY